MAAPSAPPSRPRPDVRDGRVAAAALCGVALIAAIAARYRLDRVACTAQPGLATAAGLAALYAVAVLLLAWAWRRGTGLLGALAVHAVALAAAPFLSNDPLMYAALGRAFAGGATASTNVSTALGTAHPFLVPLPVAWRTGTSAYGPAWNALAAIFGRIAGDDLALALRLHQLAAAVALLGGAWIASRLVEDRRRAFTLVALCPLAIVEATVGAHNDALLVPLVAGALWAWGRRRLVAALLLLALGLAVKASAALFLGPALLATLLAMLPTRRARSIVLGALSLVAVGGLGLLALLHDGPLDAVARIVGSPDVPYDHCTRSVECLPRVLFRFVAHAPVAAWATGLFFRVLGIAWLGWISLRAAEAARDPQASRWLAPSWLARGLFVYLLLLHGWAQSWYALPLLPLLPILVDDDRYAPALHLYLVTSVVYYALLLPYGCLEGPLPIALSDAAEGAITVFPPLYLLLRSTRVAAP